MKILTSLFALLLTAGVCFAQTTSPDQSVSVNSDEQVMEASDIEVMTLTEEEVEMVKNGDYTNVSPAAKSCSASCAKACCKNKAACKSKASHQCSKAKAVEFEAVPQ